MKTTRYLILFLCCGLLGAVAYRLLDNTYGSAENAVALSQKKTFGKGATNKGRLEDRTKPGRGKVNNKTPDRKAGSIMNAPSNTVTRVLTAEEKKAKEMRGLLDEGKEREALEMARELMFSSDPLIRSDALTALGWVGWKALPELMAMMKDSDEAVAQEAFTQWKLAVGELTNEDSRFDVLVEGLQSVSDSTDIDAVLLEFNAYPDDRVVEMIQGLLQSTSLSSVLRESLYEQYQFTTGQPWASSQEAEAFIQRYRAQQLALQNDNPPPVVQNSGE